MRRYALVGATVLVGLGACGEQPIGPAPLEIGRATANPLLQRYDAEQAHAAVGHLDAVPVPQEVLEASRFLPTGLQLAAAPPKILYLNFDGATIIHANKSDSLSNTSFIGGGTIAPFPGTSSEQAQVVQRVKQLYAAYNVEIVTSRPASGNYTMVVVGGSPTSIGMNQPNAAGVGPMDCDNQMPRDVAFAFAYAIKQFSGGYSSYFVQETATTIAHEAGHTFGLPHTGNGCDIMSYSSCSGNKAKTFLDQQINMQSDSYGQCGFASINTHQTLLSTVGPASTGPTGPTGPLPDTMAPQVEITTPANGATVSGQVVVEAKITDDQAVAEAGLYVDGALAASRKQAPYRFTVQLAPGVHSLVVRALDPTGNAGQAQVAVTVAAPGPSQPTAPGPSTGPGPSTPGQPPAPDLRAFGLECADHDECDSGICAQDASGARFCTQLCEPTAGACPQQASCVPAGVDRYACGRPVIGEQPVAPSTGGNGFDASGGCDLASSARPPGGGAAVPVLLALGALLAVRRRRRPL